MFENLKFFIGSNRVLTLDEDGQNVTWNVNTPGNFRQSWTVQEALMDVFITEQKTALVLQVDRGLRVLYDFKRARLEIAVTTLLVKALYTGSENQQWFWDGQILRSSKYPDIILVLSEESYTFLLEEFDATDRQKLSMKNNYLLPGHCINSTSFFCEIKHFKIGRARDYFFISSKLNAAVLETSNTTFVDDQGNIANEVNSNNYHGGDSQIWFWDGDSIRSKTNPDKVLSSCTGSSTTQFKICIYQFNAGDNQRWRFNDGTFISHNKRRLTVSNTETIGGKLWSLNSHHRVYFTIVSRASAKLLTAANSVSTVFWTYRGSDNQLWFWDDDLIRSKLYPDKVLDLHVSDFENHGWGKVYLNPYNNGSNQHWKMENESIVCTYANLHLEIATNDSSKVGATIKKHEIIQMWSLNGDHRTYFRLTNGISAKVLIAKNSESIYIGEYSIGDNQLWFWEGDVIRSKVYPESVMDLDVYNYEASGWGRVYLHKFNGGDNQRWHPKNGQLVSSHKDLRMDVNGINVGGTNLSQNESQLWHFNTGERVYFVLMNNQSENVVCALSDASIQMCDYNGRDDQQWFWDGDTMRSKRYPDMVMDLNVFNFNSDGTCGNVYLHSFHGGNNQRWYSEADRLVTFHKHLALSHGYPEVGGCIVDAHPNQAWNLFIPNQASATAPKPSCANKIEQKIYNVVQWIPFVSTLWDLGASIGYGVAGCSSVAEKRAISMSIGLAMDVAIGATFGIGSGVFEVVGKGLEAIAEGSFKQTLKTAIKELPRGMLKLGSTTLTKLV